MGTLHIVPHTHWDREWYLPFQDMRIKLVHLIDRLLDLLESDPGFRHFTLDGQTIVLDDYLAIRPERRGELEKQVRAGRVLIGPWTVLPDEFLVSPEALVRNLLRGTADAARFGGRMDVGYVPDPFGHIGQLPQILRGFGIGAAVFRRGLCEEPCELRWEAPDGSQVLVAYLRDGYDNAVHLPTETDALRSALRARRDALAAHSAASHWLLMNGSDHTEPQRELPALLESLDLDGDAPIVSTLPQYLAALRDEIEAAGTALPVVRGELRSPRRHHLLPGVLSSRSWIKQRNHRCETLLERWAEPFAAFAERVCRDAPDRSAQTGHLATPRVRAPGALLAEAWRILLTCHPHDSICGCSVDAVHDEMRTRFAEVEQIAEEVTRQSLAALAERADTRALGRHGAQAALLVANPESGPRTDRVRARFELPPGLDRVQLLEPDGTPVPHRIVLRQERPLATLELTRREVRTFLRMARDGVVFGMAVLGVATRRCGRIGEIDLQMGEAAEAERARLEAGLREVEALLDDAEIEGFRACARQPSEVEVEFVARDLPALGYTSLGIGAAASDPAPPRVDDGGAIENEFLRAELADDGSVTLVDRRSGAAFTGLLRFRDTGDCGDSYNYCPVDGERPLETAGETRTRRRERAADAETLEIERTLRVPARLRADRSARSDETVELPVTLRLALVPGVPRLDVVCDVDNRAEDHRLELLFPLPGPVASAAFDGHFEIVERPTAVPEPGPDWMEQPRPEQPMRNFVAADGVFDGRRAGLLVATRGLREAQVAPDGGIAVTLLRGFGWLSRDDLRTRRGPAGPQVATPGGQCPGPHRFELSVIPYAADRLAATVEARAFQVPPRAVATRIGDGPLPARASLLRGSEPGFALCALKEAEDGPELIARGVNLTARPLSVELESLLPLRRARVARLDETPQGELPVEGRHRIRLEVGAHALATVRLETLDPDAPARRATRTAS
ncbi:MAG: hypothetical protein JSU66_04810 [Deltaproteobacteria bacterium]|nr:MAG: hypothetical protein JSU66_04810 [Deltaproteobacteria bacterium]